MLNAAVVIRGGVPLMLLMLLLLLLSSLEGAVLDMVLSRRNRPGSAQYLVFPTVESLFTGKEKPSFCIRRLPSYPLARGN